MKCRHATESWESGHSQRCVILSYNMRVWPRERDLVHWIKIVWNPKGHYDLHLGSNGFFTIILFNQYDRDQALEGGLYFYFSAGLYLRLWKEWFNLKTEDMTVDSIWIHLFSLLCEYRDLETPQDIGNTLGEFVQVAEQTKHQRYTAFTHMNMSK